MAFFQQVHRALRPDGPVAQQASDDAALLQMAVNLENVGSDKIHYNVVVVAGVESDVAPRLSDGPDNIKRLVAVERCNLDRYDVLDFCELPPKSVRQNAAAHGRLQVKADDGKNGSNFAAVYD